MRVSKETMERHRREVVATASAMLRERGVQGVSVAELMQSVGLTHGGFYRHFASKEALVAEATGAAFSEILDRLEKSRDRKGAQAALEDYVSTYLSQRHVGRPALGCPIAALGVEIGREGAEVRAAYDAGVGRLLEWMAAGLPGPQEEREGKAIDLLCLMVGAIVIARASGDRALSKKIVARARERASALAGFSLD